MTVDVNELTWSEAPCSVAAALPEAAKGEHCSIAGGLPRRSEDAPDRSRGRGRVQYVRLLNGNRWYAISEIDSDRVEHFSAQEGSCPRWRPFVPTATERQMVHELRRKRAGREGWTELVDLDSIAQELPAQYRAGLENLRDFVHDHLAQLAALDGDCKRPGDLQLAREVNGHREKGEDLIRKVIRWYRRHKILVQTFKRGV